MRGLKPVYEDFMQMEFEVASFTGAWIETILAAIEEGGILVASFTGAWIETSNLCNA